MGKWERNIKDKDDIECKKAYGVSEKYSWLAKDTLDALITAEAQVNIMPLLMSPQKVIEQFEEIYKNIRSLVILKRRLVLWV